MKMKSIDILGVIIKAKLGIAERAISLLPEEIRPVVTEARQTVLTVLRDEISLHLQQECRNTKNKGVRKVEVD